MQQSKSHFQDKHDRQGISWRIQKVRRQDLKKKQNSQNNKQNVNYK